MVGDVGGVHASLDNGLAAHRFALRGEIAFTTICFCVIWWT